MTRKIDFEVILPKKAVADVATPGPKAAEVRLPGVPGVPGRSAYQLAVDAGFEGTLEEWLTSLVGPQGIQGERGPQGERGERGPAGDPGYTPVRGVDYFTEEDVSLMVDTVVDRVVTESWVFVLDDGTEVVKEICAR